MTKLALADAKERLAVLDQLQEELSGLLRRAAELPASEKASMLVASLAQGQHWLCRLIEPLRSSLELDAIFEQSRAQSQEQSRERALAAGVFGPRTRKPEA